MRYFHQMIDGSGDSLDTIPGIDAYREVYVDVVNNLADGSDYVATARDDYTSPNQIRIIFLHRDTQMCVSLDHTDDIMKAAVQQALSLEVDRVVHVEYYIDEFELEELLCPSGFSI